MIEPTEPFDYRYAHKARVVKWKGVVYHFYCAVGKDGRTIAVATSKGLRSGQQLNPDARHANTVSKLARIVVVHHSALSEFQQVKNAVTVTAWNIYHLIPKHHKMKRFCLAVFTTIFFLQLQAQNFVKPANGPADVKLVGKELTVTYNGSVILKGSFEVAPEGLHVIQCSGEENGAFTQSFILGTPPNGPELSFSGIVTGSEESFPCEADRRLNGTVVVRHTFGLSSSLLNRAVYDRKWDWVLSVDQNNDTRELSIAPEKTTASENQFRINAKGGEILFHFRPHYYQKHRGLKYFEPWTYKVWSKPVVGWCSWFAYRDTVNERVMHETADVLKEKMVPFGLEYVQIDAGYQQDGEVPEKWLNPNSKFPSGLESLAKYISDRGMKPGIWSHMYFSDAAYVKAHKNLFITDDKGEPVMSRWGSYFRDGSNPATLNQLVRPTYAGFKKMGWQYYKVDGLRGVRYEGYNGNAAYFAKKKVDRVEAYRNLMKAVRSEIGKDNFLNACWGIRPELIGVIDGCRLGGDGYGFEALTQFNSFNNIVWINDPDHIELSPKEAYRSCMATSLTGSLYLLTDKPAVYNSPLIEAAKRTMPLLFTLPGQIFDVDPSRTDMIGEVSSDLSCLTERAAEGVRTSPYDLFLLEINKPFENWMILGRIGERSQPINFTDLGLANDKEYLVFEFWSKKYIGSFTGSFDMGKMDPTYNCQAFCIRQRLDHPQLLATSRHITCGGVDLKDVGWKENLLYGTSDLVANDKYTIYINEPEGANYQSFECEGVKMLDNKKEGNIRQVSFVSETSKPVEWKANYGK